MQKRLRHRSAISTAVAAIAALAVVTIVSYTAIAMLLPRMLTAAYSTTGRASQAEKDIAVRLSTVYHVQPALVVSNDGTTPIRITKIYIGSDSYPADITINPGEKRTLPVAVGVGQKVAVEVEGWGIVVLQTVNSIAESPPQPPGGPGGPGGYPFRRCSQEPDGVFTCEPL
jgi:sporulation-control protein spo0M